MQHRAHATNHQLNVERDELAEAIDTDPASLAFHTVAPNDPTDGRVIITDGGRPVFVATMASDHADAALILNEWKPGDPEPGPRTWVVTVEYEITTEAADPTTGELADAVKAKAAREHGMILSAEATDPSPRALAEVLVNDAAKGVLTTLAVGRLVEAVAEGDDEVGDELRQAVADHRAGDVASWSRHLLRALDYTRREDLAKHGHLRA